MRRILETLYEKYNKQRYVDPDPLLFLYRYPAKRQREIAGFIAASFAYGRVEMIMKTVGFILDRLGPDPVKYLAEKSGSEMAADFKGFRYRFASETHLVNLLLGMRGVLSDFSSLEACFRAGMKPEDETVLPGLLFLSDRIRNKREIGHLLADPGKKSACKRSHLFLRWMVRRDDVDPGGWDGVARSKLIVPLDRHMHASGMILGLTRRKSADLKTALEITRGFGAFNARDPVKYDFCLTRFGIRREMCMDELKEIVYNDAGRISDEKRRV